FLLRIEDTDIRRNTPTSTQQVINDLRWLGIDWDEGPEVGGPNGPYLQSQRKDIYHKYVRRLLDEQKAYYCFETAEELRQMREQVEAQKKGFVYVRPDVFPSGEEAERARAEGRAVTVRFAMLDEGTIVVNDIVRGEVRFEAPELGDFIIQKSDGFPTYNFACVVDDSLMGVTHVIRGQEHLMNTPVQQQVWKALGFGQLPKYAHMSVTVSEGRGKLSKRERPKSLREAIRSAKDVDLEKLAAVGDISSIDAMAKFLGVQLPEINIVDFFRSGYLPGTMVNFLALLGWNPGDKREIMTVEQLIESFDLSRLTKSNSLFDRDKLIAFNTEHVRVASKEKLLSHFKNYLKEIDAPAISADDGLLAKIIKACEGARTLADIERKSRFIFLADDQIEYDEKAVKKVLLKADGLAMLGIVRQRLVAMEQFTAEAIEGMLRGLAAERGVGLGKVAQPLRVAICGTTISLPIFDSVRMLGKEKTIARIDRTLKKFETRPQV
ncbi:MAG: glutamate--tRNA ligase, partial [Planctomycetota bacterium]